MWKWIENEACIRGRLASNKEKIKAENFKESVPFGLEQNGRGPFEREIGSETSETPHISPLSSPSLSVLYFLRKM